MHTAIITGITGQDGSYLAELLLSKGYHVVGMMRRSSVVTFERIQHIQDQIDIIQGDLHDQSSLMDLIEQYKPDEVYNLAAQSFVPTSWNQPVLTGEVTALGVTRMLEAIRLLSPTSRYYQASSSEMFGKVHEVPQNESTPFYPRSPYGVAKVYGHWITDIGLRLITGNLTTCLRCRASFSTMKALVVAQNSLPARSPMVQYASSWDWLKNYASGTWKLGVIGVTQATT